MRDQLEMLPEFELPEAIDRDEFYTPPALFAQWHAEFSFDIDVCATAESAKLPRYWHAGQDALLQEWAGLRCWMNPPYSRLMDFTLKVNLEMGRGCQLVVGLYPADRSEQPFWQSFIEPYRDLDVDRERYWAGCGLRARGRFIIETRFLPGRIRFGKPGNPTGEGAKQSGTFPSVLVIWKVR